MIRVAREGLTLGLALWLLFAAALTSGVPLLVPALAGWATLLWTASSSDAGDRAWGRVLGVLTVASTMLLLAAVALGTFTVFLPLAVAAGAFLGTVQLMPSVPSDAGDPAEAWARAHAGEYRGHGSGKGMPDTVTHAPFGGLLGGAPRQPAPHRDPWDEADIRYTQHIDPEKS